jgi:hypothetical protein
MKGPPMNREDQLRQGDVLLERVARPNGCQLVPRIAGRVILAYGEATGHHHAIADRECELFVQTDTDRRFLQVMKAVTLTHEEHGPVTIAPGWYEQIAPNEYAGAQMSPLPIPD